MRPKRILIAWLAFSVGLLAAAALVGLPASQAAGPPPTGTPQVAKLSHPFSSDLAGMPAGQPMKMVHVRRTLPVTPSLSMRPATVKLDSASGWQKIMAQDFEGTFPPPGWQVLDDSSADGGEYFWGKRDCKAHSGSYSMWAGGGGSNGQHLACTDTYTNNLKTWLIYGPVDLSQVTDAELQFAFWGNTEAFILGDLVIPIDTVAWEVSTDGVNFGGYPTAGPTGDWIPVSLDLANDPNIGNLTGQHAVYLGWLFESDASNSDAYEGAFVDDVALWTYRSPAPSPTPPQPTLPVTIHTTITDFMRGRSDGQSVSSLSGGDYENGALAPTAQLTAIGDWEQLPSLPGYDLNRFAAVIAKRHLFVIGGINLDVTQMQYQYRRQVYSAYTYDDGTLAHWVEPNQLPQALSNHAAVVANDHLFVLGGINANGVQKSVFSAPIKDDGTLGSWTVLPDLPKRLFSLAAVSAHGYIYVLGGRESLEESRVSDTVFRAVVNANGTLGNWETLAGRLPGPRQFHAATTACDHIYLIGGDDEVYEWQTVYQAEIYPDGSLGAWIQAPSLPKTLSAPAAAAVRGGILVTGGWNSPDPVFGSQKSVYWAPFTADCSLGSWSELTSLPYPMSHHALVATDQYVYNLGGTNAVPRRFDSVLMAPLEGNDVPVQYATFNHRFLLGKSYLIKTLRWVEEGTGGAEVNLRYRIGNAGSGRYGSWSPYTSTNPITIHALGGYLEYELRFEDERGLGDQRVSEIALGIDALPSVYLPLVLK